MFRYGWPVRQASHRLPKRRPGRAAREADGSWRPRVESLDPRILPSFVAPANYATGGHPLVLALADLNGDGVTDLVTGNSEGTVSVLLGNGDNSFQAPQITTIGGGRITSVAVADFNGDGIPDLVTANAGLSFGDHGSLSLLVGNGDGTFQPPIFLYPGNGPTKLALGSFCAGGPSDLVVGFNGSGTNYQTSVAILQIYGDGTFQTIWTYDTGLFNFPIPVVGDFNGDGNLDFAVAADSPQGQMNVFLGNGDGTFQAPQTYQLGSSPSAVAVGDLTGDGIPDLVVPNESDSTVSVLLGNGDGSFQPARTLAVGYEPKSVAVGDLNGDGRLDLAVADYGDSDVSVLLGNGDGSFQARQTVGVGQYPPAVALADLSNTGHLDLVTATYSNVSVIPGNGDGSFQIPPQYDTGLPTAYRVPMVTADFNGDGIPDVALANGNTLSVLLGNGDGSFQAPVLSSYNAQGPVSSLAVADLNNDGTPDLIVVAGGDPSSAGGVTVLLGNGDGTFQVSAFYPGFRGGQFQFVNRYVALGDFDGDNRLDLAVSDFDSNNSLSVFLGNGDGSFQAPQDYALGSSPIAVAVADLRSSGRLDIVTANTAGNQGSVSILLGNGDGSFQSPQTIDLPQHPSALVVGDLTGDGTPDLVLANRTDSVNAGGILVLLGNGDGSFQAPVNEFAGNSLDALALADFNQDGIADLAVGFAGPAGVGVLLGNGDGTFQSTSVTYGLDASLGAVADFNGDGFPDVVAANGTSSTISVLINAADWPSIPDAPRHTGKKALRGDISGELVAPPGRADSARPAAIAPVSRAARPLLVLPQTERNLAASVEAAPLAPTRPAVPDLLDAAFRLSLFPPDEVFI